MGAREDKGAPQAVHHPWLVLSLVRHRPSWGGVPTQAQSPQALSESRPENPASKPLPTRSAGMLEAGQPLEGQHLMWAVGLCRGAPWCLLPTHFPGSSGSPELGTGLGIAERRRMSPIWDSGPPEIAPAFGSSGHIQRDGQEAGV